MEVNSYRWKKIKNGRGSVAIVNIDVDRILSDKNEVIENYSGQGFTGQGHTESIPSLGYVSYKIAARHGLEYAFSLTSDHWRVTINEIQGRPFLDTNPTIVAYTIFRAFCAKAELNLSNEKMEALENFVISSWTNPYKELLPNFFLQTFSEHISNNSQDRD